MLGPDGAPGNPGDDDGDGQADWLDPDVVDPDPEELGTGDDVLIAMIVDRGEFDLSGSTTLQKYLGMANALGNRVSIDTQDEVDGFEIDLGGGARMICLAANGLVRDRSAPVPNVNTENERSLCFLIRFGGFDYMLGGDTIGQSFGSENARVEGAIAEWIEDNGINVDVLHVNHHGANNATAWEFLDALDPEVAIISAGNDNDHHHPHFSVLRRLAMRDVRVYQTEWGTTGGSFPGIVRRSQAICQGDIVISTDGSTYDVWTERTFRVDE